MTYMWHIYIYMTWYLETPGDLGYPPSRIPPFLIHFMKSAHDLKMGRTYQEISRTCRKIRSQNTQIIPKTYYDILGERWSYMNGIAFSNSLFWSKSPPNGMTWWIFQIPKRSLQQPVQPVPEWPSAQGQVVTCILWAWMCRKCHLRPSGTDVCICKDDRTCATCGSVGVRVWARLSRQASMKRWIAHDPSAHDPPTRVTIGHHGLMECASAV